MLFLQGTRDSLAQIDMMREVVAVRHQFDQAYVIDAGETTATFGLAPTPWTEVMAATAGAVRVTG